MPVYKDKKRFVNCYCLKNSIKLAYAHAHQDKERLFQQKTKQFFTLNAHIPCLIFRNKSELQLFWFQKILNIDTGYTFRKLLHKI